MGGKPHASAFTRNGDERRTALLVGTREGTTIRSGIKNLVVLKTSNTQFEKFMRDPFTTLKDEKNQILATVIEADGLSVIRDLKRRLKELPRKREIVAYCRGPYCVYSRDAVAELTTHGFKARRLEIGLPDWKALGLPVTTTAQTL